MESAVLLEALAEGLRRKSSDTCSRWAENYVILGKPIPGPLRFTRHPWSREMVDYDKSWAAMKAAQVGISTVAILRAIHTIDIKRIDVLYILPKKNPDVTDFSKGKFDTLVSESPHIRNLFSSVKNVGHKQAGNVNLYFRGSKSRSGLKIISAGLNVYDELDEMAPRMIALAIERGSGFEDQQEIFISTPTIPEAGIDAIYRTGSRESYFFKCPTCGTFTKLTFPTGLVLGTDSLLDEEGLARSYIKTDCGHILTHESKAEVFKSAQWVPELKHSFRTFYINQLYSTVVRPARIAKSALKARTDEAEDQEFWNSKGGLARAVEGAKVNDQQIESCISSHSLQDAPPGGLITIGVDVGHKVLYVTINQWFLPEVLGPNLNSTAIKKNILHTTVNDFFELMPLLQHYQAHHTVIDIDPAFRSASDFANQFPNRVSLCRFTRAATKKTLLIGSEGQDFIIQANRTAWLDISQGRFRHGKNPGGIILPKDTLKDFREHIKAPVRHLKKDDDGNVIARYITPQNQADHYAFANVYDELALPLAVAFDQNQDVKAFL